MSTFPVSTSSASSIDLTGVQREREKQREIEIEKDLNLQKEKMRRMHLRQKMEMEAAETMAALQLSLEQTSNSNSQSVPPVYSSLKSSPSCSPSSSSSFTAKKFSPSSHTNAGKKIIAKNPEKLAKLVKRKVSRDGSLSPDRSNSPLKSVWSPNEDRSQHRPSNPPSNGNTFNFNTGTVCKISASDSEDSDDADDATELFSKRRSAQTVADDVQTRIRCARYTPTLFDSTSANADNKHQINNDTSSSSTSTSASSLNEIMRLQAENKRLQNENRIAKKLATPLVDKVRFQMQTINHLQSEIEKHQSERQRMKTENTNHQAATEILQGKNVQSLSPEIIKRLILNSTAVQQKFFTTYSEKILNTNNDNNNDNDNGDTMITTMKTLPNASNNDNNSNNDKIKLRFERQLENYLDIQKRLINDLLLFNE